MPVRFGERLLFALEQAEIAPCVIDDAVRHSGEFRDVQTVALIRGTGLHAVQEYELAAVLGRVEVDVRATGQVVGQARELEVVGREERQRVEFAADVAGRGPGERQPVERARAAPDLVHQHEARACRIVQDPGRFGHFDHERRVSARQVVGRPDAREYAIHRADDRGLGRHEAADMRQDDDERRLAHVSRLAAHVRAGDDEQSAVFVEREIVRHERLGRRLLDADMPPGAVLDPRFVDECGPRETECRGALGEVRQRVDFRDARGRELQGRQPFGEAIEQFVVKRAFAGARAFPRSQDLVFEFLEFGRDEALGRLERLPANVVRRRRGGLGLADLDVEAMHLVVTDLEFRQARALALRRLVSVEKLARVGAGGAQLVESGVVAVGDDAAVAHERRRCRNERAPEQAALFDVRGAAAVEFLEPRSVDPVEQCLDPGDQGEAVPELREIARPRRAQRDARQDAFEIADLLQRRGEIAHEPPLAQGLDRLLAFPEGFASPDRPVEPGPREPAAHRSRATVHDSGERELPGRAEARFDLEVAPGLRVEDHGLVVAFARECAYVRQFGALRFLDVLEQTACGADGRGQVLGVESRKIARVELSAEQAPAGIDIEVPRRAVAYLRHAVEPVGDRCVLGQQEFGRIEAFELARERIVAGQFRHREPSAGEIEPGETRGRAGLERRDVARLAGLEQGFVGQRSGRDDPDDTPFHRALALRRIADLLADRDRLAEPDEPREIGVDGVIRHARHRDRFAGRLPAFGQHDVDERRGAAGVLVEEFVEVAHAEKKQRIGMLGLDGQVLLHYGGVGTGHEGRCVRAVTILDVYLGET